MLVNGFVSEPGMSYALIFRVFSSSSAHIQCIQQPVPFGFPPNATLHLPASTQDAWITWVGDTEYDMDAGDVMHDFSFRGADPVTKLQSLELGGLSDYGALLSQHTADIKGVLASTFALDLGQTSDFTKPTDVLRAQYTVDGQPAAMHTSIGCSSITGDIYLRVAPGAFSLPICRANGQMG